MKSFHCMECNNETPMFQRSSQTFTFVHKMMTHDVEVFMCTECYLKGGLSEERREAMIEELKDAQDGARW